MALERVRILGPALVSSIQRVGRVSQRLYCEPAARRVTRPQACMTAASYYPYVSRISARPASRPSSALSWRRRRVFGSTTESTTWCHYSVLPVSRVVFSCAAFCWVCTASTLRAVVVCSQSTFETVQYNKREHFLSQENVVFTMRPITQQANQTAPYCRKANCTFKTN